MPAEPAYYPVAFVKSDGLYCLDGESARGLLKNRELALGYAEELKSILTNLKGDGK